jgi:hypothetical protein
VNKRVKMMMSTISPNIMTRIMYLYNFHKILTLKNPKDINEKLQYLKLKTYYNNPVITRCVDKYQVRGYLEEKGFSYLLPDFIGGAYENADELRKHWDEYPDKFVVKCNHGCGYNILVKNKNFLNANDVAGVVDKWMHEDYWKIYCEPQYKNVPKRIIVEEYLADDINTYKFYCFNGKPEVCYVSKNGEHGEKDYYIDYFDMEWNWLPISLEGHKHYEGKIEKPNEFEKMKSLSAQLASDFPFVRVDLYDVAQKIYFSELTFIPTGGNMKLIPKGIIKEWGEKLKL